MSGTTTAARHEATRRSWRATAVTVLIVLIGAALSLSHSAASIIARANPQLASSLAPWDGRFEAEAAASSLATEFNGRGNGPTAVAARQALIEDATAVDAAIVLALQAELSGNRELSDGFFAYALSLSRRELRPHLWAIERAVNQGDYRTALRHYDLAMRTSGYGQEMLYPILANALQQEDIRREVIEMMAGEPAWRDSFLHYLAVVPRGVGAAAKLYPELVARGIPFKRPDALGVIDALADRGEHREAWALDQLLGGERDWVRSRDPQIAGRSGGAAAFDWKFADSPGVVVSLTRDVTAGGADFSVAPQSRGVLLRQTTRAPVGRYRLASRMSALEGNAEAKVEWILRCVSGRQLASVRVVDIGRINETGETSFEIPDGCPVQILELIGDNRSETAEMTGRIVAAGFAPET